MSYLERHQSGRGGSGRERRGGGEDASRRKPASSAAADWAAKRKAAMDRAKQLREERRRGELTEDYTFKPTTNPRRGPATDPHDPFAAVSEGAFGPDDVPPGVDSLDAAAAAHTAAQVAQRSARRLDVGEEAASPHEYGRVPSPGSDALTYELRRAGHDDHRTPRHRQEDEAALQARARAAAEAAHAAAEADALFHSQLRGGGSTASPARPEWNADTEVGPSDWNDGTPRKAKAGRRGSRGRGSAGRPGSGRRGSDDMRREIGRVSNGLDPPAPAAGSPRRSPIELEHPTSDMGRNSPPPPLPAGAKRGGGRLLMPEDIVGGPRDSERNGSRGSRRGPPRPAAAAGVAAAEGQSLSARPRSGRRAAAADPSVHAGSESSRAGSGRGFRDSSAARPASVNPRHLEHEVAEPKLRLLKKRISSSRRMKRAQSGGSMDSGSGSVRGSRRGASSAGLTRSRRDEFSAMESRPDAAPARSTSAAARAPPVRARVTRSREAAREPPVPAATAPSGGGAVECTRQQGCPCADCRAAESALMGPPMAMPAGDDVECTRTQGCPCRACRAAMEGVMAPAAASAAPVVAEARRPCPDCGRKFSEQALQKHRKICRKVFQTKRAAFDSTKARVSGTEAAKFVSGKGGSGGRGRSARAGRDGGPRGGRGAGKAGGKKGKWAAQSSAFRAAMRASRVVSQAEKTGDTAAIDAALAALPAQVDDRVPCPNCGRKFNEQAAERHIPRCKNIVAKPKRLVRGQTRGLGAASRAKERRR